jgi:quercetin dioxygenase-like cupin family protein
LTVSGAGLDVEPTQEERITMVVLQNGTLEFIETPGANASAGIATPSRGASEVSVVRQRQQPGGHNPLHSHHREEVMVMLQGEIAVTIGEQETTLAAGDSVIIPAHSPHRIANSGQQAAEWLLIAPAGVRFFHADGAEASPAWSR